MSVISEEQWVRAGVCSRLRSKITEADEGHQMWTGAVSRSGYGNFRVGRGKYATPQRVVWELEVGPLEPEDRLTKTHQCPHLLCVASAHWIKLPRIRN